MCIRDRFISAWKFSKKILKYSQTLLGPVYLRLNFRRKFKYSQTLLGPVYLRLKIFKEKFKYLLKLATISQLLTILNEIPSSCMHALPCCGHKSHWVEYLDQGVERKDDPIVLLLHSMWCMAEDDQRRWPFNTLQQNLHARWGPSVMVDLISGEWLL